MNIMVVDDSLAMRLIVMKTLREAGYGGHDITQAADGAKALEAIQQETPDLVLCDWNMPNMTGPELLETLKDEGIKLKFGFVTTEASEEMRERAAELGANFLIAKPFTPESFQEKLNPYIN